MCALFERVTLACGQLQSIIRGEGVQISWMFGVSVIREMLPTFSFFSHIEDPDNLREGHLSIFHTGNNLHVYDNKIIYVL